MPSKEIDKQGLKRIECLHCKARNVQPRWFHMLGKHLAESHDQPTGEYQHVFPGAPIRSDHAPSSGAPKKKAAKKKAAKKVKRKVDGPPGGKGNPFIFKCGVELTSRDDLTSLDIEHVPAHDPNWEMSDEEIEKWECYAISAKTGESLLDVGPTGCGKTSGIKQFAAALNQPLVRFQCSGDARIAHFVGEKVVEIDTDTGNSVVKWKDGVLTSAIRHGWWLVLDELDACPPQIHFILHSVLEAGGTLTLPENGGEVVARHPNFAIKASANTLGRGDDTGLYEGTFVLNEAFLDRFEMVLNSGYPSARAEIKILLGKTNIKRPIAVKMREIAERVREGQSKEECDCTFSTRRLLAWASKCEFMTPQDALKYTVLNKMNPSDKKFILAIAQRYIGGVS